MISKYHQGKRSEEAVATYLGERGFVLLAKNYRVYQVGEIDLIMLQADRLLVIEVKSRLEQGMDFDPRLSIHGAKIQRIKKTLQVFLMQQGNGNKNNLTEFNIIFLVGIVCHNTIGKIGSIRMLPLNQDFL